MALLFFSGLYVYRLPRWHRVTPLNGLSSLKVEGGLYESSKSLPFYLLPPLSSASGMDRDNLSPRAQSIGACVDGLASHLETIVSRIAGLPSHAGGVTLDLDRWALARSENVLFSIICFLISSFVFDLSRLRGCGAPEWAQSFPLLFVARSMACTIRWNVLHAYLSVRICDY